MPQVSLIYVTCSSKTEAKNIAKTLVQEKLIACANIIDNVTSIYEYNNKSCEEDEVLIIIKTISGHFQKVKNRIIEMHSYDIPCIVEVNTTNAANKFTDWVANNILHIEN